MKAACWPRGKYSECARGARGEQVGVGKRQVLSCEHEQLSGRQQQPGVRQAAAAAAKRGALARGLQAAQLALSVAGCLCPRKPLAAAYAPSRNSIACCSSPFARRSASSACSRPNPISAIACTLASRPTTCCCARAKGEEGRAGAGRV